MSEGSVMREESGETRTPVILVIMIFVSIFINSYVFFKEPFEFYFGYLIYIVLLPGFIRRFGLNRNLTIIFFVLLVTGMLNVFLGNNTVALFLKVFVGLALSYFFYDYVIQHFEFDMQKLFRWYMIGATITGIIGIVQFLSYQVGFVPGYNFRWILNKWGIAPGGLFGIRINSFLAEPTHLGSLLSAAFFVSVYNLSARTPVFIGRIGSMIIVVAYLLSFSGLGQLGIFLSLLFLAMNYGLLRYILLMIPVFYLLFNYLYENVTDFRQRYDGLIALYTTGKFELGVTHGSSFILYNNYHVATENFKSNFMFGSGIGSHPVAFDEHSLAKNIQVYGFNLNSADANSMLLRLISETGLFGVLIFLFILIRFYVPRDIGNTSNHWLISNGILIMILLNLLRQGHYFLNGFPFFVLMYIYNWYAYQAVPEVPAGEDDLADAATANTSGNEVR